MQKLADALQALGAVLVEMTAEEVAELLGEEDDEVPILADDPVELASMSAGQKAMIKLAAIGRRARARKPLQVEPRAGKVISADNEKKLRSAHEHMTQACEILIGVVGEEEPEEKGAAPTPANDDEVSKRREAAAKMRAELGV